MSAAWSPRPKRRVGVCAACQESRRHLLVPAHDGRVKCAKPACRRIRIGAFFEQEFDELPEPGVCRQDRGADAPGIGIVHVGAGGHEELRRGEIADARRKHQRRVGAVRDRAVVFGTAVRRHRLDMAPHVRPGMHIGTVREQHLDHLGMFLRNRPHQRCLAARGRARSRWRPWPAIVRPRRDCLRGRRP